MNISSSALITNHARSRLRSRSGLNKKSVNRIADRVLDRGYQRHELSGNLRLYVDCLYRNKGKRSDNIRVYGDKVYIFVGLTLITVLQIPSELTKNMKQMIAM